MNFIMNLFGYPLGWIMWLGYKIVPVYWVAIILFTFIVRAAMLPLSVKQQKNMAHGQLFRPKIDAINKKYSDNKEKAQEEINKLYAKEGYNPFGGCSSLFLQLPIIYGLIDVIYRPMTHLLRLPKEVIANAKSLLETVGVDFTKNSLSAELTILGQLDKNRDLLIEGTSKIEGIGVKAFDKMSSIDLHFLGMNLGDTPTWAWNLLILIPIFSLITAMLSSYISMKQTSQGQDTNKGCNYAMTFLMPFMSAYFSFLVPAGVGFYWIISNIVAGVQGVILRKIYTPEKMKEILAKEKAKGKNKKKKKTFMEKMVEAQGAATAAQGAYSDKEKELSDEQKRALAEAKKRQNMKDKDKLAEARRRYAEKYGDDI